MAKKGFSVRTEKDCRRKVEELTERKCLVEVKPASMRDGRYGVRFAKLPVNMKLKQISKTVYTFSYDKKAISTSFIECVEGAEAYFALYKISEELYIAYDITHDEQREYYKKIFTQHNQIRSQKTGFVNNISQVHISMLDFYLLSGYTMDEWVSKQKQNKGGFVMEWDTTAEKCLFSIYFEPSEKKYSKFLTARQIEHNTTTGIKKVNSMRLNFYIPGVVRYKGNVKVGQTLIDTLTFDENGRAKLTFEALPRICECCGRPIYLDGDAHIAGSMCAPCVDDLERARAIIADMGITASADRLETAISSIEYLKARASSIIKA